MKKFIFGAVCACFLAAGSLNAQPRTPQGYHKFTDTKVVETTSVKDQNRSGTCWSFSALGLFESEMIRTGKGEVDLSPMWIARHTWYNKVVKYVRLHGKMELSDGGAWDDVVNVINEYGIVPEEAYMGLNYGFDNHDHGELAEVLTNFGKSIVANKSKRLSTAWKTALNGILDAYFGPVPEKFTYNGKEYTPKSFTDWTGLKMDDYVCLGSYTHHPFYTQFAIEVPDNWSWGLIYNVPIDELMQVAEDAINKGYAIWWGSDVSEPGFVYPRGIAFLPPAMVDAGEGTELSKWVSLSSNQQQAYIQQLLQGPVDERIVTQEERQEAYDNYETTDDHGMVITGLATDQDGKKYFKVKNSWAESGMYKGYFYVSMPFFRYKTMDIGINKAVLSKDLRNKLGIK